MYALKVVGIGVVFNALLHPNRNYRAKEGHLRVDTYVAFSLLRGWGVRKELPN